MSDGERGPAPGVIEIADGFWNLRGSLKIAGVVDIGTHASLVRRQGGGFVMLDAIALSEAQRRWLDGVTERGARLEAFLHLHPFHTVFVRQAHAAFPGARLYGTARHAAHLAGLPWEPERTEDEALRTRFADDLELSVPRGVDLVTDSEHVHCGSVLAIHRVSRTLHVDDTITYLKLPGPLRALKRDVLRFHPTLGRALARRRGAAEDFRAWARALAERCRDVEHLCAAHSAVWRAEDGGRALHQRLRRALDKAESTLRRHERAYG